jgi:AraC-like DNA-binding protein
MVRGATETASAETPFHSRRREPARQFLETTMKRFALSTDDVSQAERFSYWREVVNEGLIRVSGERNKDQETPFNGQLVGSIGDSFSRFHIRADGHPAFRRPRDIARHSGDAHVVLYRERSAGVWFGSDDGREYVTRPGDVVVSETIVPFGTKALTNYDYEAWLLPRKLFDPHLSASPRRRSLHLSGGEGVVGMVRAYLDSFSTQLDALDDHDAGLVAENFCRLLAVAWGASAGEHGEAVRLARLEDVKRYVGLNLTDPRLTPEKVAAALKISVRQLHLLFEPSGTSFAQYVLSRRLEECKAALLNPIGDRSVTDIALAWGFASLATFHRNFQQAFAATPGELRGQGQNVTNVGAPLLLAAARRADKPVGAAGRRASPAPNA